MGGHASSGVGARLTNTFAGAAAGTLLGGQAGLVTGAMGGLTSNGIPQALMSGTLAGLTGGISGVTQAAYATVQDLTPKPQLPKMPDMPAPTPQATAASFSAGGYNMDLSQQMAMSAGGTIFSTPTPWYQQQISNQGPGRTLTGT